MAKLIQLNDKTAKKLDKIRIEYEIKHGVRIPYGKIVDNALKSERKYKKLVKKNKNK